MPIIAPMVPLWETLWQHAAMPPIPRRATAQDCPAIEALVQRAYAHYTSRIGQLPGPMLDDYAGLIDAGRVHVIARDASLQALLVLIPEDDAMLLDNVAVDPVAQGSGLGRVMLEFAEASARAAGFALIRLYTNEAMTENLELYARLGYAQTHRARVNGLKRVYMSKPLPRAPGAG